MHNNIPRFRSPLESSLDPPRDFQFEEECPSQFLNDPGLGVLPQLPRYAFPFKEQGHVVSVPPLNYRGSGNLAMKSLGGQSSHDAEYVERESVLELPPVLLYECRTLKEDDGLVAKHLVISVVPMALVGLPDHMGAVGVDDAAHSISLPKKKLFTYFESSVQFP